MAIREKFIRIDRKLSQHSLADLTQGVVSQSVISLIEKGRVNPTDVELRALADALGFKDDPARLLDHVDVAALGPGAEFRDAQREARRG